MARPTYPSDEKRRKNKPAVRVHHSVVNHPTYGAVFDDAEKRGIVVGIWLIASRAHATKTGDWVSLSPGDVVWVSGRRQYVHAMRAVREVCELMTYETRTRGTRIEIHVRNFSRKQGFAPDLAEGYSATPDASESDSQSESNSNHPLQSPFLGDGMSAPENGSGPPDERTWTSRKSNRRARRPLAGEEPRYPEEFERCWEKYPERLGTNSKAEAFEKWRATVAEGVKPVALEKATERYAHYCREMQTPLDKVMQASRFYAAKNRHWEQTWFVPPKPKRPAGYLENFQPIGGKAP